MVIAPDGPKTYTPDSAVLTSFQATKPATGPESASCVNSHFFTLRDSAEEWSKDRPDVTIMLIEEAFTLVKQNLLDVVQPILDQLH